MSNYNICIYIMIKWQSRNSGKTFLWDPWTEKVCVPLCSVLGKDSTTGFSCMSCIQGVRIWGTKLPKILEILYIIIVQNKFFKTKLLKILDILYIINVQNKFFIFYWFRFCSWKSPGFYAGVEGILFILPLHVNPFFS